MKNAVLVAKMFRSLSEITGDDENENQSEELRLTAVYSDDPENPNAQWSKWTPGGDLSLTINNPAAIGKVPEGEYMVYVVPCAKSE